METGGQVDRAGDRSSESPCDTIAAAAGPCWMSRTTLATLVTVNGEAGIS